MNKSNINRNIENMIKLVFSISIFIMFNLFYIQNLNAYDNLAQIFDSAYGQDGSSGTISMNFDSNSFLQNKFTHDTVTNNQRLYVTETGTYKLSYSCVWEAKAGGADGGSRRVYENFIRINGVTNLVPSESDVYIRGDDTGAQAGGYMSSTSATLLSTLNNGDYIELRGGLDSGNNELTESTNECFLTAQKLNTRSIEVYDNSGGQTLTSLGASVVVNLDATYYNGDAGLYSLASDRVTVTENGWYKLSYTSCLDQSLGARISPQSWIRKNTNTNISLSFSYAGYTRGGAVGRDKNCNRANTLINLNSNDYLELQTGIYATDAGPSISLISGQSWLLVEKVELDSSIISILNSGQQIDHGVPSALNFDLNDKLGNYVSHVGSSSQMTFEKSGLYEITYNVGYQDGKSGDRVITCGYLRKNGGTNIVPSNQCIYTRGLNNAQTGTVSSTSIINVSKDDYLEIMLDVTGEVGTDEYVQVQKGTTWVTVTKINETVRLIWDSVSLDLGTTSISTGDLIDSESFAIEGEGTRNVDTTCTSGDCLVITDNWVDGTTLVGTDLSKSVEFTCDDSVVGSYSAIFSISSDEDSTGTNINVSCVIEPSYGDLSVVLNNPTVGSKTNIIQNETFIFNATISCDGVVGSLCGNVTIIPQYNNTGSSFSSIPIISSDPLWTSSVNPQYCILNKGEFCEVNWVVNMTGFANTSYELIVNVTPDYVQVLSNVSGGTDITIIIPEPDTISWDSSAKNIGSGGLNLGNVTGSSKIVPNGDHTGININCETGDCLKVSDNWVDGTNLLNGVDTDVSFTCDDSIVGMLWAEFSVVSNEDLILNSINVSCFVTQTYGVLNVTIIDPVEDMTTTVNFLSEFDVNATVICEGTPGASCGDVSGTLKYSEKSLNYGDGSDGILTVNSMNTIVNTYTYLVGNELSSDVDITVNSVVGFSIGDEILIVQMQDGLASGSAGNHEFGIIKNITGSIITLESGLSNTYGSGTFNARPSSSTQVVRVPQYSDVTVEVTGSITAPAWNGITGGVVVMRAQNGIVMDGYIDVSEKGFRGGDSNGGGNAAWGDQGEGTSGLGTTSTGSNENGGGGGDAGAIDGAPGGGGGYGTFGGIGNDDSGYDSSGGSTEGDAQLNKIFLGGGAGAGGDNNARTPLPENVDGGGIAILFAKELTNARVLVTGETGIYGNSGTFGGVSGSGAGGTIWLGSNYINLTDVDASGGPAVNGYNGDVGGVGGDGRIRLDYLDKVGSEVPSAGYTSSDFNEVWSQILNSSGSLPFEVLGSMDNMCSGTLYQGSTCFLSWLGYVNSFIETTYKLNVNVSSPIATSDMSGNSTVLVDTDINITIDHPINGTKVLDGGDVKFKFKVVGLGNGVLTCEIFVDGTLEVSQNCDGGKWISVEHTVGFGIHNWSILALGPMSMNHSSETMLFNHLQKNYKGISKSVESVGMNIYDVNVGVLNYMNYSNDVIVPNFVSDGFNSGSWSLVIDFTNSSTWSYGGIIYGWDLSIIPESSFDESYGLTRTGLKRVKSNYVVGID